MRWYLACWSLLIPEPLLAGLVEYIRTNEIPGEWNGEVPVEDALAPCYGHVIDLPGMCSARRTYHDLHVAGLDFRIPSTDYTRLFRELIDLPLRHQGGEPHYRLYGSVRCLVLTAPQREELLQEMGKQLALAREIGDWEARQLNAAFGGEVVPARVNVSEHAEVYTDVMKSPLKAGVVVRPWPVIDREIDEA